MKERNSSRSNHMMQMKQKAVKLNPSCWRRLSEAITQALPKPMETNIYISPQEAQIGAERLPIYTRAENAPSMRLTERDRAILGAIHGFDGVLADHQIQRLFFQGKRQ